MGRVTRVRYDFDNNGSFEGERVYTYDATGRVMTGDYTYADDGAADTNFLSFSIASKENEQLDFTYYNDGRLHSWQSDSATSAFEYAYAWKADGRLDDATLSTTDKTAPLTTAHDYTFAYNQINQLAQWTQSWVLMAAGTTVNYTITDILNYAPSGAFSTDLLTTVYTSSSGVAGGQQSRFTYTWGANGRPDQLRVTKPSDATYQELIGFQYDSAGRLISRAVLPNDFSKRYTWSYIYDDSSERVTTWNIDMGSNGSAEARVQVEWESAPCQIVYAWADRAYPNFVAAGHEPYVPGTGIMVISPCIGYGGG